MFQSILFHNLSKVIWICGLILAADHGKYQCSFSTVLFVFTNNFVPYLRPMMFLLVVLPPCALCNPGIAWSRVWCFRYASLSLAAKKLLSTNKNWACTFCNPGIAWSRVWCFGYASWLSFAAKKYHSPIRIKPAPSATSALPGAECGASGMPRSHWPLK